MTTAREARRRLTREQLLTAARDLFESRAYAATTVDDIAAAAGTTRATLYLHFASKADMLAALVDGVHEQLGSADESALPEVVASGDPTAIRAWLGRRLDQWAAIRADLAMVRQSDSSPDISATVGDSHDRVISLMRHGLDAVGRFRPETREIRCTLAFGALEYLSRRFVNARGWADFDRERAVDALALAWTRLLVESE